MWIRWLAVATLKRKQLEKNNNDSGLCMQDFSCHTIPVHGTYLKQIRTRIDPLLLLFHNNYNLYWFNPILFNAISPRNATADLCNLITSLLPLISPFIQWHLRHATGFHLDQYKIPDVIDCSIRFWKNHFSSPQVHLDNQCGLCAINKWAIFNYSHDDKEILERT